MARSGYRLDLPRHTVESAPDPAKEALRDLRQRVGSVPNVFGYFANAPGLLHAYLELDRRFREESRLSAAEQEVILMTISRESGCGYCVAAHSYAADRVAGVPRNVTAALRDRRPLPDARLNALSRFTQRMWATRGAPDKADFEAFHRSGFDDLHALDVVLALGLKTLSNVTNHLCHTEVDALFREWEWV